MTTPNRTISNITRYIQRLRGVALVALSLLCGATMASAQGMPGGMGGGMGRGGGGRGHRGGGMHANADSLRVVQDSLLERRGFAGVVLDRRHQLQLTDSQVVAVTAIDAAFHQHADTLQAQLDSLRALNAHDVQLLTQPGSGDTLPTVERNAIVARRRTIGACAASLRTLQQDTRTQVMTLLTPTQQTQITTLASSPAPSGGRQHRGRAGGVRSDSGGF